MGRVRKRGLITHMRKEQFEKVLKLMWESHKQSMAFCKAMDKMLDGRFVPIYDSPLTEAICILFEEIYGKEGLQWIRWFIWEKDWGKDKKITATDEKGRPFCRNTIELWEYLEKLKSKPK
jgi:hypothetical protein